MGDAVRFDDLDQYAAANARPRRCRVCRIKREDPDLWAKLSAGRARGYSYKILAGYLRDKHGLDVKHYHLRDHWSEHEGQK